MGNRILDINTTTETLSTGTQGTVEVGTDQRIISDGVTTFHKIMNSLKIGKFVNGLLVAESEEWIPNNYTSLYKLDGNSLDETGAKDGTPTRITYTDDRFGNPNSAAYFDGTGGITTSSPRALSGTNKFSLVADIRCDELLETKVIFQYGEALPSSPVEVIRVSFSDTGFLFLTIGSHLGGVALQQFVSSNTITLGVWTRIGVSYNGDTGKAIIVLDDTITEINGTTLTSFVNSTGPYDLIGAFYAWAQEFIGAMDDLYIFDTALTPVEIGGATIAITICYNPDRTLIYAMYEGGFKVLNADTMATISTNTITGASGTPTKLQATGTKLIFKTDNDKINVCNVDGTSWISANWEGNCCVTKSNIIIGNGNGMVVPSDYIARWRLDDNTANSTVLDEKGIYNGVSTVNTDTISTDGFEGNNNTALAFSNSNNIAIPNLPVVTEYSFIIKFKGASGTGIRRLLEINNAVTDVFASVLTTGGLNFGFYTYDGVFNGISAIPIDGWNVFVCTAKSNDTMKLYHNGKFIDSSAIGVMRYAVTAGLVGNRIGSSSSDTEYYTGIIDDIPWYNRVLTQGEAEAAYKSIVSSDLLLNKTYAKSTLNYDNINLEGFAIGDYTYSLIQSATDNNCKILRYNTVTHAYDTLILSASYNTVSKFYLHVTSVSNYAMIHTTTGNIWRVDLLAFGVEIQNKRLSIADNAGVITIEDSFDIAELVAENYITSGFGDDPTGDRDKQKNL